MNENLNLVEILKDCPKGMELDCTVYNDVTFLRVDDVQNRCYFKAGPADTFWTTCEGRINGSPYGKCVVFPKGKTTWEGFKPKQPTLKQEINWEQRRYEIAKEMMYKIYRQEVTVSKQGQGIMLKDTADFAVAFADVLINKLKNENK